MKKYKFIAYNEKEAVEDVVQATDKEDAMYKIQFEYGLSDIVEIKEVFDFKAYLDNAKSSVLKVGSKMSNIKISFSPKDTGFVDKIKNDVKEKMGQGKANNEIFDEGLLTESISSKGQDDLFFEDILIQEEDDDFFEDESSESLGSDDLGLGDVGEKAKEGSLVKKLEVVNSGKVKKREIMAFFSKTATLLEADVSIVKGLDIIKENTKDKKVKYIINVIENDLNKGEQLSSSMSRFPNIFSDLFISLISAGEKSGSLPQVFKDISSFLETQMKTERKMRVMLIYPMIVAFILSVLLLGAGYYVEPQMEDLLSGFGVEIPWYAKIMFAVGRHVYIPYVIFFVNKIFNKVIRKYFYKLDIFIQDAIGNILIKLPIIKHYIKAVSLYYYTNTISIMLNNNLSILLSLEQGNMSMKNKVLQRKFANITGEVAKGRRLSKIYKELNIDPILPEMVSIGEESGRLADSFKKISQYFNSNLQNQIDILTEVFQPATIVLMGIIITPILMGVFVPLMKATSGGYM